MQKILLAIIASAVVAAMLPALGTLAALATPSPGVPGSGMTPPPGQDPNKMGGAHPGASNTATSVNCGSGNAANTPGNSGPGGNSNGAHVPGSTGNTNYNQGSPGQPAGSQYDVSCFQQTSNPGHTP